VVHLRLRPDGSKKASLFYSEILMTFFDRYFVKTGMFDKQFSKIVHAAFDTRQDNDYEDFYVPSEAEAQEQYDNATQLIREIKQKCELIIQNKLLLPKLS